VPSQDSHHKTVIIGGGSAGILVAAALISAGESDVAVIDPAEARYYWNLMLKGRA
jgi:sulfide:quinone oxidoreductase